MATHSPTKRVFLRGCYGGPKLLVNAVVDTAAQVTSISEDLARLLRIIPCRVTTLTINGTQRHEECSLIVTINRQAIAAPKALIVPGLPQLPPRMPPAGRLSQPGVLTVPGSPQVRLGWDVLQHCVSIVSLRGTIFGPAINLLGGLPSFKQQCVLVLGQDTTEMYRLVAIRESLRDLGYFGLIVKEIDDIEVQSTEEKVNMLASLCKFVICDNSVTSGHIDELKICAVNRFVTAILQQDGMGATWMQADYPLDYGFMQTFRYSAASEIASAVKLAAEWADKKVQERKEFFNKLYHWRK